VLIERIHQRAHEAGVVGDAVRHEGDVVEGLERERFRAGTGITVLKQGQVVVEAHPVTKGLAGHGCAIGKGANKWGAHMNVVDVVSNPALVLPLVFVQ